MLSMAETPFFYIRTTDVKENNKNFCLYVRLNEWNEKMLLYVDIVTVQN